ncbi:MAG: CPBP family intramembrane metalloprotease [Actinomycetota bacterium]|nr:CPBP family intramembrane metalloprotease [Actinomycetota bacterium]
MRRFANRRPLAFALLCTLVLFGLTVLSRIAFPRAPVGNIDKLPEKAFEPPSGLALIYSDIKSPDTLFWALAILLALGLLAWMGWWREAGFNRPSRWRNLRLLWFPLLVGALTLSGGAFTSGAASLVSAFLVVLVATVGEEIFFRGVVWRTLTPMGPISAMILTSLFTGVLVLSRTATDGPWPEAVRLTALAVCGGFTYAALRWRTTSIWPGILVHTAFAFSADIATLGTITYPLMMLLSTLGFVAYGLYLLRNRRVRADGGLVRPEPSRVR